MGGSSLHALIDDIASILDDVAAMSKVAAKKTAGVLGDDLALNAQQIAGVSADRELPVVWAVARGSAMNKLILVPAALAISAFAPWAVRWRSRPVRCWTPSPASWPGRWCWGRNWPFAASCGRPKHDAGASGQ